MSTNLIRLFSFLAISAAVSAQPAAQLRLNQGEKLGFIHIAVRPTLVSPATMTVEEGLYQFIVFDPQLVATGLGIDLEDERGLAARQASTRSNGSRSSYTQRLAPGRYSLRIGARSEWIIQLTVSPKKQAGAL